MEPGASKHYVVANGIPSAPVNITVQNSLYAAAPDFNHDGKADILWRDQFGVINIWEMNNGAILKTPKAIALSRQWTIVGTGDFNGDGFTDILLHDSLTGAVAIWLMNNGVMVSTAGGQKVAQDWSVIGTGDFNGDRKSDILWRNSRTGAVAVWLMNGGAILASGSSYAVGLIGLSPGLEISTATARPISSGATARRGRWRSGR